jgi:hypothetical protein
MAQRGIENKRFSKNLRRLKLRPLGRRSATLSLAQQSAPHKCATDQWPDGELRPLGTFDRPSSSHRSALSQQIVWGGRHNNAALRLKAMLGYPPIWRLSNLK